MSNVLNSMLYWSIILLPFSVGVSPGFANAVIAVIIITCLAVRMQSKKPIRLPAAISVPLLCIVIFSLASFWNTVDYRASAQGMIKLLKHILLLLACAYGIKDKAHFKKIVISAACGIALVSIDALWQMTFGKDFIYGNPMQSSIIGLARATAVFPGTNAMAVYLAAITPLVVGLAFFCPQEKHKVFLRFAGILGLAGIYVAFSRGAAIGAYVALLIFGISRRKRVFTVVLLLALLLYPFIMPKQIKGWVKQIHYNPAIFLCNEDRLYIYLNALNMIRHHPFVGVGVNAFSISIDAYRVKGVNAPYIAPRIYAHNNFLHMAGEIGLLGLAAFIWFLFAVFRRGIRLFRRTPDDYVKVLAVSALACCAAFLINGLTETSLYYARVSMTFWYMAGLSLALENV
ncbi:MAG TPA: O-antigen ligase family protein [Patescibacteria group bacterium]|nr:O-antigen ligase family protein [Patescibacteria group bacterium]